MNSNRVGSNRPQIDARRLWSGGVAAAVVAVLATLVGILIVRGVLGIPVLAPKHSGALGGSPTARYVIDAAVAALVATGVLHLLLWYAPTPFRYFNAIILLAGLALVLLPFSTNRPADEKTGTALINAGAGLIIWSLVTAAGKAALPPPPPSGPTVPPPPPRPAATPRPDGDPGHPW